MTEPTVLYAEQGAIAIATLNRPQSLNSFTRQMHHDLWAALDQAEANPAIRALVITGAGRAFCAGADLSEFDLRPGPDQVQRADPGPIIEQAFNPTVRRLQRLRMPTLAAINGVAAGAGASLAMTCDIAIAAPSASFIQAFSKIGLIPDAGGTWFLTQRLGLARAMGLASATDIPEAIKDMNARLGLPSGLGAMGVQREWFDKIIVGALADHCHKTNPRIATAGEYEEMLADSL